MVRECPIGGSPPADFELVSRSARRVRVRALERDGRERKKARECTREERGERHEFAKEREREKDASDGRGKKEGDEFASHLDFPFPPVLWVAKGLE